MGTTDTEREGSSRRAPRWLLLASAVLPLLLLAGVIGLFLRNPPVPTAAPPAPIERLEIERVIFHPQEIALVVRNTGPQKLTIAQVIVNDALWQASFQPGNVIPRLARVTITLPYLWVEGEAYNIHLLTSNGIKFTKQVEVAALTPTPSLRSFGLLGLLGVYVGLIPVYLGLLWLPFLRRLPRWGFDFLLSLTVGLLLFLGIEALGDTFELAADLPNVFHGTGLIALGVTGSLAVLFGVSHRARQASARRGEAFGLLVLAYLVALGIGLHNLGEGLAIGGAYAVGEIALGTMLVLGFTLHNLTEGVAIVAPVTKTGVRLSHLVLLGLLAGGPTILGTWIGGFAVTPIWAVLFLAIGAGAIFQVVYAILRHMVKAEPAGLWATPRMAGLMAGLAIMWVTGLMIPV